MELIMFDQVNALLPQFSHLNVVRLCWIFLRLLYSLLWLETANHTQTVPSIKCWGLISYARGNFDSVKGTKAADMTVLLSLLPNTIIAFLLSLVLLCFQKRQWLNVCEMVSPRSPSLWSRGVKCATYLSWSLYGELQPRMQNVSLRSSLETKITRVSDNESSVRI